MFRLEAMSKNQLAEPPMAAPSETATEYDPAARARRVALIKALEETTGTRVISYVTGDRPTLQTVLAGDAHSLIYSHLAELDRSNPSATRDQRRLGMFLYTAGGVTTASWGVVNLIRDFADSFTVFVPYKALSAGTLVALGADTLHITRLGQLSPVDPSLNSPYNPAAPGQVPGAPPQFLPVSVEAVMGYISLAKEVGLKGDEALSTVLKSLTDKVHPLALGDVYRSREQITTLASRLLKMGKRELTALQIESIVETLTKRLGSHDYLINRSEAKELLGGWVKDPTPEVEKIMMNLYREYADLMKLNSPYNPDEELGGADERELAYTRAAIESANRYDAFTTLRRLKRVTIQQPGPIPMAVTGHQQTLIREGWRCFDRSGTDGQ